MYRILYLPTAQIVAEGGKKELFKMMKTHSFFYNKKNDIVVLIGDISKGVKNLLHKRGITCWAGDGFIEVLKEHIAIVKVE